MELRVTWKCRDEKQHARIENVDIYTDDGSFPDNYINIGGYFGSYNPELFAAAPDMYDALESAEESIATFIGVHGYPTDNGAGEILRQVSAALAKARGE